MRISSKIYCKTVMAFTDPRRFFFALSLSLFLSLSLLLDRFSLAPVSNKSQSDQ